MKKNNVLYIVVPCYNEELVLNETSKKLKEKVNFLIKNNIISSRSKVVFVNDGSTDRTWEKIYEIHKKDSIFTGISLSRNKGHQNALLAGLMVAKEYADIIISMDADLQDDINAMDEMIEKYYDGNDIVYGVRKERKTDSWFKRITAESFYKIMQFLGVDIIYNHADYRLTSKRVLNDLENFSERNLFLRGIFPLIGYSYDLVYYERAKRFAGKSKYPLKKMLSFAWEGITSFSVKPIKMILNLGIIIFVISIFVTMYCVISKLIGNTVDGWAFLACSLWMIGGIQMFSIGVVGEYIGKIYNEAKRRPRYIIAKNLLRENNDE